MEWCTTSENCYSILMIFIFYPYRCLVNSFSVRTILLSSLIDRSFAHITCRNSCEDPWLGLELPVSELWLWRETDLDRLEIILVERSLLWSWKRKKIIMLQFQDKVKHVLCRLQCPTPSVPNGLPYFVWHRLWTAICIPLGESYFIGWLSDFPTQLLKGGKFKKWKQYFPQSHSQTFLW
jgi:hypothetical protein